LKGKFTDEDPAKDESKLGELQQTWLALGHTLKSVELLNDFIDSMKTDLCAVMPDQICIPVPFAGTICVPNPVFIACGLSKLVWNGVAYALKLGASIAFQIIDDTFTRATQGPDKEMYSYYYSRATYHNTKQHNEWNVKALGTLRQNMKDQVKQAGGCYFFSYTFLI
jgi:hypothetical protein